MTPIVLRATNASIIDAVPRAAIALPIAHQAYVATMVFASQNAAQMTSASLAEHALLDIASA
jgi:hypothetical protein